MHNAGSSEVHTKVVRSKLAEQRHETINTGKTHTHKTCWRIMGGRGRWRKECTYRAEVEALPGLQSLDLKGKEAGSGEGDIHF